MKFSFRIAGTGARPAVLVSILVLAGGACRTAAPPATSPAARDGGDAQRLVALLDYVGSDYGVAVENGRVVNEGEYQEQMRFVADAQTMLASLLGAAAAPSDPLSALLRDVQTGVEQKAHATVVSAACRTAKDAVVTRFRLRTMPSQRPSLADAEALYTQACVVCHGARGDADTERARELDPRPASFRDPERLRDLSPYRVYNTLTFGVPGTAMASFETLSPAERWSLAFFVFRLGHGAEASAPGPARAVAMPLAEMAARSDGELLEALRVQSHPDPRAGLAQLRREAPFSEPPAGAGIEQTRGLLRQAIAAFAAGRRTDAERLVLDAYLQGFEPLEARLRARDPDATLAVEASFRELRSALGRGDAGAVRREAEGLESQLFQLAEGTRAVVPFAAAFLIFFREGIEAALLVGALLAGVRRLGRPEGVRHIHFGWIAALPAGLLTWWVLERIVALTVVQRELMEAAIALVAALVLFSVSFWMISKAESRRWTGYLRKRLEDGLNGRRLRVLSGLAFLAVYREAAETVLFTQALMLDAPGERFHVWGGAAAGLAAVAAAAFLMSRAILRLPLGLFFGVSGVLLCGLAISFAGSGIYELVSSGYLSPRPVPFPEIPWMGIHPDLTGLLVQLAIVLVIAGAAVATLVRRPALGEAPRDGS